MPDLEPVYKLTILPRGRTGGHALVVPEDDKGLMTRSEMIARLVFAMGGRSAEELVFHEPTTGASSDIDQATKIARAMVTEYGMSDKVGPLSLGHDDPNAFFMNGPRISAGTAEKIDEEVNRLLGEAHDRAEVVLKEHRELLDKLAAVLLVTETIDGADLEAYAAGTKEIPDPATLPKNNRLSEAAATADAAASAAEPSSERRRAADRITLPPAPPMPTVD
jgi:cell division protease FtsH